VTTAIASAPSRSEEVAQRWVTGALGATIVLLAIVGIEAHQIVRHLLQVTPIVAALVVVRRRKPWGLYAALPVHAIWLTLMTFIWLLVLGIAQIFVQGIFTPIEVVITVLIGAASVTGIVMVLRTPTRATLLERTGAFLLFGVLQAGCVVLSLQSFIPRF
jgi:hypothetical protein